MRVQKHIERSVSVDTDRAGQPPLVLRVCQDNGGEPWLRLAIRNEGVTIGVEHLRALVDAALDLIAEAEEAED